MVQNYYTTFYGISATSAHTLCYSKELDPTEWRSNYDSGSLQLLDKGGAIKKIVAFGGYLMLFREHSLQRLYSYVTPDNNTISTVFETSDAIYPESVVVADNKIVFLAGKNLYTFDGYNLKEIASGITPLIEDAGNAVGAYLRGVYYLAVKMKKYASEEVGDEVTEQSMKNNAVLSVDLASGDVGVMRGADIAFMSPIVTGRTSELLVGFNGTRAGTFGMLDESGSLFGSPLAKVWIAPATDMNKPDKQKTLRRAYITSSNPVTLTVNMGAGTASVNFSGAGEPECKTITGTGSTVALKLSSSAAAMYISDILLWLDARRRYCGD